MTVTFDRSVASSIMEAGYNYTPTGNSTIAAVSYTHLTLPTILLV